MRAIASPPVISFDCAIVRLLTPTRRQVIMTCSRVGRLTAFDATSLARSEL